MQLHNRTHGQVQLWAILLVVAAALGPLTTEAFSSTSSSISSSTSTIRQRQTSSTLNALTERQLQFWEDVEAGLTDIESFYQKKGQSIDRIRMFAQSAQGAIPPPTGDSPGHAPSEEHVEGLTAQPFWDAAANAQLFPWAEELERKAHIIQTEFQTKLREANQFSSDSVWQNQVMGDGWSAIRLQRLGVWNAENCQAFPQTYELLRNLRIPLAVRGVCFARQAPDSGVQEHSDGRNFILTSHLGLQIPKGGKGEKDKDCWIKVGTERRGWEEGKLTTLDTSFLHSTGNPTTEDRHVLIIDFWHPELRAAERDALDFVYDLRNKFESGLVPFRKPKSLEPEGEGLAGLWKSITGGE